MFSSITLQATCYSCIVFICFSLRHRTLHQLAVQHISSRPIKNLARNPICLTCNLIENQLPINRDKPPALLAEQPKLFRTHNVIDQQI